MPAFDPSCAPRILGWAPADDTIDEVIQIPIGLESYFEAPWSQWSDASSISSGPSSAPSPASTRDDVPSDDHGRRLPRAIHSRDPDRIPRPRNPFIIFRCEYAKAHTNEGDTAITTKSLSKRAAEAWKHMLEAEKEHYKALAAEEKKQHEITYPDYRFRPRRSASRQKPSRTGPTPKERALDRQAKVASLLARKRSTSTSSSTTSFTEGSSSPEPMYLSTPTPSSSPEAKHPALSKPDDRYLSVPTVVHPYRQGSCQSQDFFGYSSVPSMAQAYLNLTMATAATDDVWSLYQGQYEPLKHQYQQSSSYPASYLGLNDQTCTVTGEEMPMQNESALFSQYVQINGLTIDESWDQTLFESQVASSDSQSLSSFECSSPSTDETAYEEFRRLARPLAQSKMPSSISCGWQNPSAGIRTRTAVQMDGLEFTATQLPMV